MTRIVKAFLAAVVSLAIGLAITERLLRNGGPFDVVKIGPWNIPTRAGATDADPYTRASLERSGEIPLALGEGLQLFARNDSQGRTLDPRCSYSVGPHAPSARYWTLELVDLDGFPVDNPSGRFVFRSSEILRDADGAFAIWVSATAHAGNWLPIGAARDFALVLRLYDSPLSATAGGIEKTTAPTISRQACT